MKNKTFNWPEKKIALQDLLLDSENYRLTTEENTKLENQKDIIDSLIKNDQILRLAKQISKHGFVPVEKMIVLKKGKKYIVLEGNRRLTALKCLINPRLAKKPSLINSFSELGKSLSLESIKQIPVFIAPSRKEALSKVIIPKHTEPSIQKWSTYNQSKLYAKAVLEQGETIDQVCSSYGTIKERVLDALRMYQCYKIATKIPLSKEIMTTVLDERKFPITTLDRLIKTEKGQNFLGIRFDNKGLLKGKIKKDEFIKGYSKIISDIALKRQTSRTLDSDEDRKQYLDNFKKSDKPNLKQKGSFSLNSFKKPKTPSKKRLTSTPKLKKKTLKDYSFNIPHGSAIILELYKEIETIDFYKKPYTFGIVFRSFLEMCCAQYSRNFSLFKKIKSKVRKKRQNEDPRLKEFLLYFKNSNEVLFDQAVKSSIGNFLNEQNSKNMTTINFLHKINHSNTTTVNGTLHTQMLNTLEQLLRELLKERDANS